MFPAPAGMSPWARLLGLVEVYVPRTCGDEPNVGRYSLEILSCSPHLRG